MANRDAVAIIESYGEDAGWNDNSKLAICLEYINNQADTATFEDFVRRKMREELEEDKRIPYSNPDYEPVPGK